MAIDNSKLKSFGLIGASAALALHIYKEYTTERPEGVYFTGGHSLLNLIDFVKNTDRMHDYILEKMETLDVMTFYMPMVSNPLTIITIDPQNVEHVLKGNFKNYLKGPQFNDAVVEILGNGIFNANGENWKYQRKAASHVFNVKNFRDEFTDVFVKEMRIMCNQVLSKHIESKTPVDFHELMFKFTLDSFVYLGFGVQLDSLLKEKPVPFAVSFDALQRLGMRRFINPLSRTQETLSSYLKPWKMSTQDHVRTIDSFAADVIAKRRQEIAQGQTDHKDLLSRFMNTTNQNGEKLDDVELRDTVLNFIIAGRDTTAQALSWLFYNLSSHPEIEQKMLEELGEKVTDADEEDAAKLYEIVSGLTYMHAVFFETLRLHPSVPTNQKYALEDDVLPDGTVIKAGYYVIWSPHSQGRSTKIWGADAKEFNPERWLDEEGNLRRENAGKWPAFHAGPRICLGQNLATLEALVCIIMLIKRFKFTLVPNQNITYELSLTLPMKNGMKVYVEKRS